MAFTLGLIADDLTGANDSAVQFARRGWQALLVLSDVVSGFSRTVTGDRVLAVTTDSRALDNASAEKLTADALAQLMAAGIERIYLKIDSTMRGSVPGQVAGVLAAWRTRHPSAFAVVCPAYPRMARTVIANQLLVNGQPVEQSSIGRDPVTPVTASDLAVLIPGSTHVAFERILQDSAPIVTVDAASDNDLANVASAIAAAGPSVIPVGSAGLAQAMAEVWSDGTSAVRSVRRRPDRPPRILLLVTSLNPVSRAQVGRLTEAFPHVVVLLAPAERVGNHSVAENLAADFAERVGRETCDVLGLIGGDGARAALRCLGASAIEIVDTMLEGIPFGIVVGGRADGMPIFTKAGGFGAEDALVRVVEWIRK